MSVAEKGVKVRKNAKLSVGDVLEIRRAMDRNELTAAEAGEMYGVSHLTIRKIARRVSYLTVPEEDGRSHKKAGNAYLQAVRERDVKHEASLASTAAAREAAEKASREWASRPWPDQGAIDALAAKLGQKGIFKPTPFKGYAVNEGATVISLLTHKTLTPVRVGQQRRVAIYVDGAGTKVSVEALRAQAWGD